MIDSSKIKSLCKHLLRRDLSKRFGNLKNGVADIKKHKWFNGFDYNALMSKSITPPYTPASTKMSEKETNWSKDKLSLAPEIKKKEDPFANW